ncbi:hypothetical protein [Phaffia rhodozyma]|uniref:Uncharacterized protein n=1 Tax=Phaffia rhodozyma TaxID=264483 RepID=A0A0F7SVA1_PHARH|nr:hypothetical protein [Phaffia rhodozyma]
MQFASIFASTSTAEPPQASRSAFSNKRKHDLDGTASRSEEIDFSDRKVIHVRKQPRLPPLNLPTSQASFQSSSPSSSPLGSSHSFRRHAPGNTMDVDCAGSSDSECELRTPSVSAYPMNLAQYPFGIMGGKTVLSGSDGMVEDGMSVDEDHAKVGVLGIGQDFSGSHGAHCNQIPRLVLSHPNPMGERSLWAVCQDCGAASPAS